MKSALASNSVWDVDYLITRDDDKCLSIDQKYEEEEWSLEIVYSSAMVWKNCSARFIWLHHHAY